MKAKEYVEQYKNNQLDLDGIIEKLLTEANELAKARHCTGLEGGSFGDYARCFLEQGKKWIAICKLLKIDDSDLCVKFNDRLQAYYKQVFSIIERELKIVLCVHLNLV